MPLEKGKIYWIKYKDAYDVKLGIFEINRYTKAPQGYSQNTPDYYTCTSSGTFSHLNVTDIVDFKEIPNPFPDLEPYL